MKYAKKIRNLYPEILKTLLDLLSLRHKKIFIFVIIVNIVNSIVCVFGIASIMPFVSLLANPSQIENNAKLRFLYELMGVADIKTFMLVLGLIILAIFLISNVFMALSQWVNIKFARGTSISLANNLMYRYVSHDYEYFLYRNSAELLKNIFTECLIIVGKIIQPGITLISKFILTITIIAFVAFVSPGVSLVIVVILGGLYGLIFYFMRMSLARASRRSVESAALKYKAANEIFGGIKDIKLLGKEDALLKQYYKNVRIFEKNQATIYLYQSMPKFVLESIAFGGMLGIVLLLYAIKGDLSDILPIIAIYGFAAYRLMPSMEHVFRGLTSIKGSMKSLEIVHKDFIDVGNDIRHIFKGDKDVLSKDILPLDFSKNIELKNISFKYRESKEGVIRDLSLVIDLNTTNAFVGTTGCGKTTIVDIILGLLKPQNGDILIDGQKINDDNVKNWQKNMGYVPQQIYLSDDTVIKNIAFGIDDDKIDMNAIAKAAKAANIHDFIINDMPDQYNTVVGERGVRLSGGQRQRIGIARALYHDPKVLVLDEATSALDNVTEHAVMKAIDKLAGKKTILMIAHRLSTVKKSDKIFLLNKGRVADQGKYADLLERNDIFKDIANKS